MSTDWRTDGVRVIPGDALDDDTPQTPGMHRAAAVTHARAGAEKLWAGTVTIHIHVVRGRAATLCQPIIDVTDRQPFADDPDDHAGQLVDERRAPEDRVPAVKKEQTSARSRRQLRSMPRSTYCRIPPLR